MCNSGLITGVRIIIIIIIIIVRTGRCVIYLYIVDRVLYINLYYYTGWVGCSFCLGGIADLCTKLRKPPLLYAGRGDLQVRWVVDRATSRWLPVDVSPRNPPPPTLADYIGNDRHVGTHITSWGQTHTHTHIYIYIIYK